MPMSNDSIIGHRTQALATVALTRRDDVRLLEFPDDVVFDFFLRVLPEASEQDQFMGTAVVVKGTSKPLDDEGAASEFAARTLERLASRPRFYFPVLMTVFSMQQDKGYYCWLAKPNVKDGPRIEEYGPIRCHALDRDGLDRIVDDVRQWYRALGKLITATAS